MDYYQGLKQLVNNITRTNLSGNLPGYFDSNGEFQIVTPSTPLPTSTSALTGPDGGLEVDQTAATATGSASAVMTGIITGPCAEYATLQLQLSGTFAANIQVKFSLDNVTWSNACFGVPTGASANAAAITTFSAATAGSIYSIPVQGLYYQVNCTAYTSGTVVATVALQKEGTEPSALQCYTNIGLVNGSAPATFPAQSTKAAVGVLGIAPTTASTGEVTSAARTASGNSGTISSDYGQSLSAVVQVTASSGTTPTLDVVLQESFDNGTTWQDCYHLPRFTTTGTATVPYMTMGGVRRWSWTIAGTSPSFTFKITTMLGEGSNIRVNNYFDRNIVLTTLSSTTSAYSIEGCNFCTMAVYVTGTPGAAAVVQMQFSNDGVNWYNASATLTTPATAGVTAIAANSGYVAKFVRAIVTTAGTTDTLGYVNFYGTN